MMRAETQLLVVSRITPVINVPRVEPIAANGFVNPNNTLSEGKEET